MGTWPEWWNWEVELSAHLLKRMEDRRFNQTDLRLMIEDAFGYHEGTERGRYVVQTRREGGAWEVIVEPVPEDEVLVIVTAYPLESEG